MLSIIAVGTIDKKLIYRKRKKGDDVKKYTKTINPDLPGQQTQKGYFKEAINEWVTAGYSSIDIQAWNLYARSKKVIASGFNRFTGLKINAEKEGNTWNKLTNCNVYDVTAEGFKVDINVASDLSGVLYLGTSKFSMLKEFAGTFEVNKYTFTVTGLSKLTRYYFYIKNTSANESGRTGIYSKKTTLKIPVIIDIGSPAIDRPGTWVAGRTVILATNPSNASGKIKSIEVWAYNNLTGFKIGTFYKVSGTIFTCRDWVFIGNVTEGSKQTFEVDIEVKEGDYIGEWFNTGKMERSITGSVGWWTLDGDNIPCTEKEFSPLDTGDTLSIYGTGIET